MAAATRHRERGADEKAVGCAPEPNSLAATSARAFTTFITYARYLGWLAITPSNPHGAVPVFPNCHAMFHLAARVRALRLVVASLASSRRPGA